jgi:hypothetical protein
MIAEHLLVYTPQKFRNKQNFHNHGAIRENRRTSRHTALKRTVHYP